MILASICCAQQIGMRSRGSGTWPSFRVDVRVCIGHLQHGGSVAGARRPERHAWKANQRNIRQDGRKPRRCSVERGVHQRLHVRRVPLSNADCWPGRRVMLLYMPLDVFLCSSGAWQTKRKSRFWNGCCLGCLSRNALCMIPKRNSKLN